MPAGQPSEPPANVRHGTRRTPDAPPRPLLFLRLPSLLLLLLLLPLLLAAGPARAAERVILDTDLGDDVDDAGTFAVLHALADRGEIEILAVGIVNGHKDAVPCADAINTWYGRPNLPLGSIANDQPPIHHDTFKMGEVAAAYPHDLTQATAPDAVGLYRRSAWYELEHLPSDVRAALGSIG